MGYNHFGTQPLNTFEGGEMNLREHTKKSGYTISQNRSDMNTIKQS